MEMPEQIRAFGAGRRERRRALPTLRLSWLCVSCSTLSPFTSNSRAPGGTPARSAAPPGLSTNQKEPWCSTSKHYQNPVNVPIIALISTALWFLCLLYFMVIPYVMGVFSVILIPIPLYLHVLVYFNIMNAVLIAVSF